jgi:transcriptional regulator with PAS, ATPase and Fis domain
VAINCGAIPSNLVESELFGSTRGAFSGAIDRPGLIRSTHGGTLFLDEIGELPLAAQVTLLRVLEEHRVIPIGGTTPITVDFRVCAATHQDLDGLVAAGRFRADLRARLEGYLVRMPPLRGRREDLGLLIADLLKRRQDRAGPISFSRKVAERLVAYEWPANIRELEKCLEVAQALAESGHVRLRDLPERVRAGESPSEPLAEPPVLSLADSQLREELRARLREHGGNVSAVARSFGKHQVQIRRWMKRFGLTRGGLDGERD